METTTNHGTLQQIDFASIPRALQSLDQWLLWKSVVLDGKVMRTLLSVFNTPASPADPASWTSFDNAGSHYNESQHSGIGFVFTSSDRFCSINLIGCRDPETGTVADWALRVVHRFSSYTEISPSRTGLTIVITTSSSLPNGKAKEMRVPEIVGETPSIEIYTQGRYSALTGKVYEKYRHIENHESEFQAFLKEHWPVASTAGSGKSVGETSVPPESQRVSPTTSGRFKIKSLVSTPFPIGCLPSRLGSFVQSVSQSVGCDHSFAAFPAMAVVSTAIGNSRWVSTKQGNHQPLVIWPMVIGLSGSQKSEPFDLATECLNDIENNYEAEFNSLNAKHRTAMEHYKLELKAWKSSGGGDPPLEPESPLLRQMVVKDTTSEALIKIHAGNPRGLLCSNEELSAWFASFERYAGKGPVSGEQAKFLEFYDGKRTTSDRATAKRIVIYRSFINVTGTIQPGIMQKALTSESRSNGLASRMWMVYPQSVLIRWRDEFVSTRTKQSYATLVRDLLSLSGETDAAGFEKPALLNLSPESRKMFAEYMNDTGEQCFVMFGDVRAAWAKFIGRCARLAGIIHCCRQADGEIIDPWTIDTDSMQAAIVLCEWSKAETLRVYELLKEDAATNSLRLLAAWIKHHGGCVTARELCKHKRDIESSEDAEQWLRKLQDAGFGTYEVQPVGPTGGRPTAKFILKSESL